VLTSSVVAVGERLVSELNRAKIPAVHCTIIHDGNGDPYANAAETIEMMLKIYPTVEYVIDLHRMTLTDEQGNMVKTCSANQIAQLRMTVSTAGVLTKGTLSLAMRLRGELNSGGARVCMPVVLTDSEYNAAGSLYYLKLDVGSLGNSSDEACAAAALFAEAFAEIIVG
jgi:stage II sporulation protein P